MRFFSHGSVHIAYKWWVTLAVALGMIMSLMDSTIVNIAIPQMQHTFGANLHDLQWVVTIYMLTQAAVIPAAPYLNALFGGKRVYIWTLIAFLLGSLLCGFAWNLPSLIFFRLLQGIGGGILLPMVMILQYQVFPLEERGRATSVLGLAMIIAPTLGPVIGGFLVSAFGWRSAFFINLPLGVIAVTLAQKTLQQTPPQTRIRFDIFGFLTAAAGSSLIVYSVSTIVSGATSIANVLLLLVAFLLIGAFVAIELHKTRSEQQPLLDLRRFRDRAFTCSTLTQIIVFFIWFGGLFLIPIYLQTLHQETALQAGLIQGSLSLAPLAILPFGGKLTDRFGPRPIVLLGLCIMACAFALLLTLTLHTPIWMLVCLLFLLGCPGGLTNQIPVAAFSQIKKEEEQELANASALLSVLRAAAAPLGVAVFASVVQNRSQYYLESLARQGLTGIELQSQSLLFAMHESFLSASILALAAFAVMTFVPRGKRSQDLQPAVPLEENLLLDRKRA